MLQTVDESEVNLGRYKKHLLYSKTEINQAGVGSNFAQFTRHLTARATRMPPCAGQKLDIFSQSPLNTDTQTIRTLWNVSLVSALTGFHCKPKLTSHVIDVFINQVGVIISWPCNRR